ncbi:MAG: hypothetical protein ACK56G_16515 [Pirellulaceae bacterium]
MDSPISQDAIEHLASFLLELAKAQPLPDECIRCGQEPTHHHQGMPYCELCRGCYLDQTTDQTRQD